MRLFIKNDLKNEISCCSRQELGTVRAQIDELFVRINDIQRKAIDSETMVQEICRDIKKLDFAKQHLTHAITALR